ncbi:hypothetical protein IW15_20425 [Chryseobacterium soli]|uniref:DUF2806 domain-containing protein n=1 Tax=Chryseobacterium soli TaxID=445961 RepID=A0A086A130_9FLAO|nr:DUF2806 domain-containing protein [Chryseobacterium soli]KFF10394.1 hypothetical protein IW15_20425 [Chryseobacterium soli]
MNEQNDKDTKFITFFEELNKIPLPGWIKNNILIALGKGIGKLIISGFDWPTAYLESKSLNIRTKAEGNRIIQIEAAKNASELFKADSELATRALHYYAEKIVNYQNNREDIATNFVKQMQTQKINEENQNIIDEDWLDIFWSIAETKTNENLKFIFGKILAQEITNPKSISPITLQLIAAINSNIGEIFTKLCNLSIDTGNLTFVVHPKANTLFSNYGELSEYGISINEQMELEGLGLIRSINSVSVQIRTQEGLVEANYAGRKVEFNFDKGVSIIDLTRAGREIRNLLDLTPNQKYTDFLFNMPDNFIKFKE